MLHNTFYFPHAMHKHTRITPFQRREIWDKYTKEKLRLLGRKTIPIILSTCLNTLKYQIAK